MQGSSVDRRRSVRTSEMGNAATVMIFVVGAVVVFGVAMFATMIGMTYLRMGIDVRDRSTHREEEMGQQREPPSG